MTLYEVITVVLVEADSEEDALERESIGMGELQEWTAQHVHEWAVCQYGYDTDYEPESEEGWVEQCTYCAEYRTVEED